MADNYTTIWDKEPARYNYQWVEEAWPVFRSRVYNRLERPMTDEKVVVFKNNETFTASVDGKSVGGFMQHNVQS